MMGVSVRVVANMAEAGELPFLRLSEGEFLIPAEAVRAHRAALSSRALLVLRCDSETRLPRQTLAQRRRKFLQRTKCTVEDYLIAFEDGGLDMLNEDAVANVIEAEELIAAERRR
jgi:hypothetical protein